jgi:hypothetical protein
MRVDQPILKKRDLPMADCWLKQKVIGEFSPRGGTFF